MEHLAARQKTSPSDLPSQRITCEEHLRLVHRRLVDRDDDLCGYVLINGALTMSAQDHPWRLGGICNLSRTASWSFGGWRL
jgi:hypothetical protein